MTGARKTVKVHTGKRDCVAYFYKDPKGIIHQDPEVIAQARLNVVQKQKNQLPMEYSELASLARDHSTPERALLWASLPKSEKSLGASIVKKYSPKKPKDPAKQAKKLLSKSQRKQMDAAQQMRQAWLNSPDPSIREAARDLWGTV